MTLNFCKICDTKSAHSLTNLQERAKICKKSRIYTNQSRTENTTDRLCELTSGKLVDTGGVYTHTATPTPRNSTVSSPQLDCYELDRTPTHLINTSTYLLNNPEHICISYKLFIFLFIMISYTKYIFLR